MKEVSYVDGEISHINDIVRVFHELMPDDWDKKHTNPNKLYKVTHVDLYMDFDYHEFFVTLNNEIEISAGYLQLIIPHYLNFPYLSEIVNIGGKDMMMIFIDRRMFE